MRFFSLEGNNDSSSAIRLLTHKLPLLAYNLIYRD